jgi:hypothetical protein
MKMTANYRVSGRNWSTAGLWLLGHDEHAVSSIHVLSYSACAEPFCLYRVDTKPDGKSNGNFIATTRPILTQLFHGLID